MYVAVTRGGPAFTGGGSAADGTATETTVRVRVLVSVWKGPGTDTVTTESVGTFVVTPGTVGTAGTIGATVTDWAVGER